MTYNNLVINQDSATTATLGANALVQGTFTLKSGKLSTISSKLLTLDVNATFTPVSNDTFFINGPLAKNFASTTPFTYQIGAVASSVSYPKNVVITPKTAETKTITANYIRGKVPNTTNINTAQIDAIADTVAYYNVAVSNYAKGTDTSAKLSFQFTPDYFFSDSSLVLAHYFHGQFVAESPFFQNTNGTLTSFTTNGYDSTFGIYALGIGSLNSSSTTYGNICTGGSYFFNGTTYTVSGTYTANLVSSLGKDSTAYLILSVNTPTTSNTKASICKGSSYSFGGNTYSSAGTYTVHLINAGGCDSTATLVLSEKLPSTSTTFASICNGKFYSFNGKVYSTTGTYTVHLTNSAGCDSAATLVLTVNQPTTSNTNASIVSGASYTFNGVTYYTAGTYVSHLTNSVGCDSVATLILTINSGCTPTTSTTRATICASGTINFNGTVYSNAGTYVYHLLNAKGCDSAATLVLTVKSLSTSITNASICTGGSYIFNGTTYTKSGNYIAYLTNAAGCDSAATLNLSVKSTSTSTTNASICAGSKYSFNGTTYTKAGTYTAHLTNSLGCDSIATLILTINLPTTSSTSITICPASLPYQWNGNNYTASGSYITHLINAAGCDSAATIVLTVKTTSTSTTNVSICAGGSYTFNGSVYTKAGSYTALLTNTAGCDSVATLVLTVKSNSSSTTYASICNGNNYPFNGNVYSVGGTYSIHLTNSVGCDSVSNLVLTVKQASSSITKANICSGNSYYFNGTNYSTSGTYISHLANSLGCDSAATLILLVGQSSFSNTNVSICEGSSYTFNGSTYAKAGTYLVHLKNSVGCDSAATLNLNIKANSTSTTNANIIQGYSYTFNGSNYTDAGTYTAHLTNSNGCDSSATLVLTVSYIINGNVRNPLGAIIPSVSVAVNGKQTIITDANGYYNFTATVNSNNVIVPSKNNDKTISNGVNGTDISLIQSHILKKVILNSPYKLIAGDVNNDGAVNGTDIALIKSFVLKHITKFSGNNLWAFVDSSYKFLIPTKPFPYFDSININNITSNQYGKNFVGVKLGDVNYDWNSAVLGVDSRATPIELFNDNIVVNSASTEVRIPIKVKNFKQIMGMQYTLNFNSDALELKSVEKNHLNVDYNTDFATDGKLPFLWVDAASEARTLPDNDVLFELVFNKKRSLLNEAINLTSDITSINAFDGNYNTVGIRKVGGEISENNTVVNTMTVYPNPAKESIVIKGNHIDKIQVIDNFGKVIKLLSLHDASNPTMQVGGLNSGVYHLRVMTSDGKVNATNFIKK